MIKLFRLLGLAALLVPRCAGAEERVLLHDGVERRALIEFPAEAGPAPALIALHGGGGSSKRMRRLSRFTLAKEGWVEIYPEGLDRSWNDGRRALAGGPLRSVDDIGFLRTLLSDLIAEGRVAPDRLYFAGISNGGAMVQRIVCQAPDLVAGAAVLIMTFPVGLACPPGPALPIQFQLGTKDPIVPFDGGPITIGKRDRGGVMPAQDTLDFYSRRNGCAGMQQERLPDLDPNDGTVTRRLVFTGCDAPLEALIVDGGGHTWSGRRNRPNSLLLARIVGVTGQDFSATQQIEAFFRTIDERQ